MLDLHSASQIVDAASALARRDGLAPTTVAALDARDVIVALKMEDGSGLLCPEIASGKACGALAMGFGTRNLAGRAEKLPSLFGALSDLARGRLMLAPGSVLVRDGAGAIIGAVGASGDIADNDEACVIGGIEAAALLPISALRTNDPRQSTERIRSWFNATVCWGCLRTSNCHLASRYLPPMRH